MTIQNVPVLPLRNIVVFPSMVAPLFIGRMRSVNALEKVMTDDSNILLVTQREEETEDPLADDLYNIGVLANIMQVLRLPDGTVKVLVEGMHRVEIEQYHSNDNYVYADIRLLEDVHDNEEEIEALHRALQEKFDDYTKIDKKIPKEAIKSIEQVQDSSRLADLIAQNLSLKITEKQELLESLVVDRRMEQLLFHMESEFSFAEVEKRVRSRVKRQMDKTQREYYLNEQMKAIQKELGEHGDKLSEADEFKEKISKLKLPKEAAEKANSELKKLTQMSPMSAEATVVRNYLEWIVNLPWSKPSRVKKDLHFAQNTLDKDHHGLERVKERIIEHLAVLQRVRKLKGPILCLVGPPGVGKTSLGRSIAEATNRKFIRMSLGGVRDEAEIRGHRRTYIGSLPGRIIQGMKKAERSNPLFLLDEIDKMAQDFRGDPSSALLEVLDPAQNNSFHDHYLELDYDLSDVMFIATANSLNIPDALRDRMEIIHLSGYTEEEKIEIAEKHLLDKVIKDHGLKNDEFSIDTEAIRDIIRYYTREAGVRTLERQLQKITRKAVTRILQDSSVTSVHVTANNLEDFLRVKQFRFGIAEEENLIGVVTGLAYTTVGGDILMIESILKPGTGKITKTGKLGEVMQESVEAAENYVKHRAAQLGISHTLLTKNDVHVHVPEGATPKDGPSAGIAMVTSIVSSLTGIEVHRDVAMTGEVTLRGRVLPIGGLKEKLLAALRGGIKKVLIPRDNEKDLSELPKIIIDGLEIVPVDTVDDVLKHALTQELIPIINEQVISSDNDVADDGELLRH